MFKSYRFKGQTYIIFSLISANSLISNRIFFSFLFRVFLLYHLSSELLRCKDYEVLLLFYTPTLIQLFPLKFFLIAKVISSIELRHRALNDCFENCFKSSKVLVFKYSSAYQSYFNVIIPILFCEL